MEPGRYQSLSYVLRADTPDARRARGRLAVGTCFLLLLAGLLTAIGHGMIFVAGSVLFIGLVAGTAALRAVRRHRGRLVSSARHCGGYIRGKGAHVAAVGAARAAETRAAVRKIDLSSAVLLQRDRASSIVRHSCAYAHRRIAPHGPRMRASTKRVTAIAAAQAARATAAARQIELTPLRRPIDQQREALRLNAAGTNERRRGAYAEAAELHSRAVALLRDVDDPRALALTQNNLALALSHLGDDAGAISLFEQATATLRGLGDLENEGKIMANLALAHRRHGRADESANVLRLALAKLERDSSAYELVQAELRRAS